MINIAVKIKLKYILTPLILLTLSMVFFIRLGRTFPSPYIALYIKELRGVVEGIWKYGNALGVPNMGGDTEFHPGYNDNCLVNVVAFGVVCCPT